MPAKRRARKPARPHVTTRKPKPWTWREVEDITLDEWALILREYAPSGASLEPGQTRPLHQVGHPVRIGGTSAIRILGPESRGRPSLPRWHSTDDLYPVLAFAAHALAWAIRRSPEKPATLSRRLGCDESVMAEARHDPSGAVPDILRAFRGVIVSERSLKTYRQYFRLAAGSAPRLFGQRRALAWSVRFFLQRCPTGWLPDDTCTPHHCRNRNAHHANRAADDYLKNYRR